MKKTLGLSFIFLVFAEFIYNISAYIIKFGLGHTLDVSEYGRYSIVITFTTMLIVLVGRGIPTAMNKRISEQPNNWNRILGIKKTASKLQLFIILSVTALFFLFSPLIAIFFGDTSLTSLFRLSSLLIPSFALSSFHVAYFNGLKTFKIMTVLKSSRGLFRGIFIVSGAFLYGLKGAIIGAILAPIMVYLVAILLDTFLIKKPSNTEIIDYKSKNLMSYAYKFITFLLFYELFTRIDLYLIKFFLHDDRLTGLYDSAMTTALIPYYGVFALTFILFPTISKLTANNENKKIKKLLLQILIFLLISLSSASTILALFSKSIINLLFGPNFSDAGFLVPLMTGGTFFGTIFYIFASVLNGAGHTKTTSTIVMISLIISIVLNSLALPIYGIKASALIFSITSTIMGISILYFTYTIFFKTKISNIKKSDT